MRPYQICSKWNVWVFRQLFCLLQPWWDDASNRLLRNEEHVTYQLPSLCENSVNIIRHDDVYTENEYNWEQKQHPEERSLHLLPFSMLPQFNRQRTFLKTQLLYSSHTNDLPCLIMYIAIHLCLSTECFRIYALYPPSFSIQVTNKSLENVYLQIPLHLSAFLHKPVFVNVVEIKYLSRSSLGKKGYILVHSFRGTESFTGRKA